MSTQVVEDALGLSATVFNRVFASSATEFQVQINASTRIVIKGHFGTATLPPYTHSYDAPQVGSISSFEIWHTSNATSAASILGKEVVTGAMPRLETLFEDFIMPADAVRSAIPRNIVVPLQAGPVDAGTASYFDIAQTDGTFLRFLGSGLAYDAQGFPLTTQGSLYGVIELDANKHDFGTGYTHFTAAGLGQISVSTAQVFMGLYDDVLVNIVYSELFKGSELSVTRSGNLTGMSFPFSDYFQAFSIVGDGAANLLDGYFGNDVLRGMGAGDLLNGRGGNDNMDGGIGNDTLYGGSGNDTLLGGAGLDRILGGSGNDRIAGGAGRDVLTGAAGADRFVYAAAGDSGVTTTTRDSITDFRHAQGDKIDLSAIDAIPGGSNQAFKPDVGGGFTAGELRIGVSGLDRIIYLNLDSDAASEMTIVVQNPGVFGLADIIL